MERENDVHAVPIQEAAARLGLSVEAVRKRARRGTLTAKKIDDHWFIVLPDTVPDVLLTAHGTARDGQDRRPAMHKSRDTEADILRDSLAEIKSHNQTLLGQIAVKDRELAQAEVERAELRRLLGNAQQQVTNLLTATVTEATATHAEPINDESPIVRAETPYRGAERAEQGLWQRILRAMRGE